MFDLLPVELVTPLVSLWNTFWSITGVVMFAVIMAFLVSLAYFMGSRLWMLAAAPLVCYILISLDFPHPTVREAIAQHPIIPLDIVRMLLGVLPGFIAIILIMIQFGVIPGGRHRAESSR